MPSESTEQRERRLAYLREWQQRNPNAHREWADAHKAHLAAYARQRRAAKRSDPEWVAREAEMKRQWREKNADKVRENIRQWRHDHPEFMQRKNGKRRARLASAPVNDLTRQQWEAIKRAYGGHCAYCGVKTRRLTLDHIIPLAKGGSHTISNVVPACHPCNSRKQDQTDWVPLIRGAQLPLLDQAIAYSP